MVDIPVVPSSSVTTAATTSANLTAVQVSIADMTAALQNLTRMIQTNAVPLAMPEDNLVTLATMLGDVTVVLPQQMAATERQNLNQVLLNALQTQRPLTLTVQAGSPPTVGALLVPQVMPEATKQPAAAQNVQTATVNAPVARTVAPAVVPVVVGDVLPAIVLPTLSPVGAKQPVAQAPVQQTPVMPLPDAGQENVVLPQAVPTKDGPVTAPGVGAKQVVAAPLPNTPSAVQSPVVPNAVREIPVQVQTGQAQVLPMMESPAPVVAVPVEAKVGVPMPVATVVVPAAVPAAPVGAAVLTEIVLNSKGKAPVEVAPNPPAAIDAAGLSLTRSAGEGEGRTAREVVAQQAEPVVQTASTKPPVVSAQVLPQAPTALPAQAVQSAQLTQTAQAVAAPSAQAVALLQAGNEVSLHVDAVFLPAATPPVLPPLAQNQVAATVVGTGTNGQMILKAGDATLFVKAQAAAPVGSTVVVTVDPATPPELTPLPPLVTTNFQALPQVMAAVMQASPELFQQMAAMRIPQATHALPGALLFLFSAFKQGNVRDWLGDEPTDKLTTLGKAHLVSHLAKELASTGQAAQDPVVGDWKSYPIPLYSQQQFQALTLYVHHDREARQEQAEAKRGAGKIRFLIDMRLSKLGDMQVDGFVQPKQLDLVLRSENVLPEGLHHELRTAYIKALGAVGYTGALNFQVGRQHWMVMNKPTKPGFLT